LHSYFPTAALYTKARKSNQTCKLTQVVGWILVPVVVEPFGTEAALDADRTRPEEGVAGRVRRLVHHLFVEVSAAVVVLLCAVTAQDVVLRMNLGQPARVALKLLLGRRLHLSS
jgi:hypothetical protein